jgi:hypothetical protein
VSELAPGRSFANAESRHVSVAAHRVRLLERIEEDVLDDVDQLFPRRSVPVDVEVLCRGLGLEVKLDATSGRVHRGSLLRDKDRSWIAVHRPAIERSGLTAGERFTVAHELAHHLILRRSEFEPERHAEYWRLEEICNRIAARLLLPESCIHDPGPLLSAKEIALEVSALAIRAQVSSAVAARALMPRIHSPAGLGRLRLSPLASTHRLGFVLWWCENVARVGDSGSRRAIYHRSLLAPALRLLDDLPVGRGRDVGSLIDSAGSAYLYRRSREYGSLALAFD